MSELENSYKLALKLKVISTKQTALKALNKAKLADLTNETQRGFVYTYAHLHRHTGKWKKNSIKQTELNTNLTILIEIKS